MEENTQQALDLNTYREFLTRISGVTPVFTDNDNADRGDENLSESAYIPTSILSYQCFMKSLLEDKEDSALKGYTPEDILEPVNMFTTAVIDASCPEFTHFTFTFDKDSTEGQHSYQQMKKCLTTFMEARMDTSISINEKIPFFFCEMRSTSESFCCQICNPIFAFYQLETISVIVPTYLVSFIED